MLYTDSWYIVLYYVYIPFLDIFDNFDFVGIYFWKNEILIFGVKKQKFWKSEIAIL